MIRLSPQDTLALQIGRHMLNLAIAQQALKMKDQQIAELEARLAEHENGVETEPVVQTA